MAHGTGSRIEFTPVLTAAHTISARIVGEFGMFQDVANTVNVTSSVGVAETGVIWSKLVFSAGEALSAKITARDSRGVAASRILWQLSRNGQSILNGEGAAVRFVGTLPGVYRVKGTAYCQDRSQLAFDSSAFVEGSVNGRHTLPVPDYEGTAVYLGAVFTQNIPVAAGVATSLPYQTASSTEDILLLPGTTHWMFDLDPDATTVDDEVVVRTKKGNWCLNGLAGGLSGESTGFDYGYMPAMIPAPADKRLRLTADFFKVHGVAYTASNSRVRVKCYRLNPTASRSVYCYERCSNSSFPGGTGRRARQWAVLFTNLDVQLDVFSGLNRQGTGNLVISYTTANPTSIPLMTLSTSGTPHPVPGYSGLFYTDSNLYAFYESAGYSDLAAKAVSAIEGVRPCCISLMTFNHSKPVISSRIKRAYGKMVVFLKNGVLLDDSYLNFTIYRADGTRLSAATLHYATLSPTPVNLYANTDDVFVKVGEIDVDFNDFQFDETGLVVDLTVDESSAEISTVPSPVPTPVVGPDYIYSTTFAHTVSFDGACYTNPTYVPIIDDEVVVVSAVGGCQDPVCGPAALYCYTALNAPIESVILPQPFGMPAPFVSYGSNPARCFYNPIPAVDVVGTNVSTGSYTGSHTFNLWTFSGTSLCGASYAYTACQSAYAPCLANNCSIIVVYPISSSPHSTIEYAGRCYSFNGSTQAYGTRTAIPVASVTAVADCRDPACTQFNANGSVVVYNDTQTQLEVPVRFEHLDYGTAHYGVAVQKVDNWASGLVDGSKVVVFTTEPNVLIYTSPGTGTMIFEIGLAGVRKQVVLERAGAQTVYNTGASSSRQSLALLPGDKVYLRVADAYGRLPLRYRNLRVAVHWHPVPFLPRLFDTVVVPYSGSTSINAVGFCAYTAQGAYAFYGTLPFNGSMTGPLNPDTLLTVTAGTQEYSLLMLRAEGDSRLFPLGGIPVYAGQALNGPFTFKFYAARDAFGAHGEMDVWFDTHGTFPTYLRAGLYDALELSGTAYRKEPAPTDTDRNSYAVVSAADVTLLAWPNLYVSDVGRVISVDASSGSGVTYNGTTFRLPAAPVSPLDPGLSYTIYSGGAVVNLDAWANSADDPWLTDSSAAWTV